MHRFGRMRRHALRTLGPTAAGLVILSGCSSTTAPTQSSVAPSPSSTAPATVAAGEVGVSAGGVTTAVGAPAESTEDDYFQSCRAARAWIERQGGDPRAQIEPYLKAIQNAESFGPATFGKPWPELSPGQQSAVIVAVQAAVDGLCG